MTGKKHDLDGESYIVSDGVDLNDIDLENMVSKETVQIPDILKTQYAQAPRIENIPGMVLSNPKALQKQQERIWLEVVLAAEGGEEESFAGYVEHQQISESGVYWQIKMDRSQAVKLMANLSKGLFHTASKLYCKKLSLVHDTDEKAMEMPPEVSLESFSIEDLVEEDCFVKVSFEIRSNGNA